MASRIRREARLAFETLSIEGGLLSPEWLARVAQLTAGHQSEEDYRVPKGLSLRDEIGRYWRIAHACWKEFTAGLEQGERGRDDADRRRALTERFIGSLLRDVFGFTSLEEIPPAVIDGRRYPIQMAALNGRVPVVVTAAGEGVDAPSAAFGEGGRRRSPFGLTQEYLNAAAEATWGFVSDGHILRILRDNNSLTRPAWIQADLSRMFSEERYADFAALWLLAHESRVVSVEPADGRLVAGCLLDTWRAAGQNEGTRAREALRDGFREALLALGQGFLSHPNNGTLRAALHDGTLTNTAYFQQLLRLVYRLIFLLTVEERDLLHPPSTADDVRRLYAGGYGLRRLRDRSLRRSAHDHFTDLWRSTTIVFRGLANGETRLGLPALAGIFAPTECPDLDEATLENRALLNAVFRLAWLKQSAGVARVNWRDMGPEELGSVYESLLELQPQIAQDGRIITFAQADETKGNARKTTGSYYTPDSLVRVLLDTALEPVIADCIAQNPHNQVEALLALSIVDPACGSGHFLLAAARRLAAHVARRQAESTPSATDYRRALRQVIGRCIFGVDLNSMAVELCKVSLWMEAVEPGRPLTFLDSHIQHGNALLGTTPALMQDGIPDEAWDPIEGDDRKVASALKKRNKSEAIGHRHLPFDDSSRTEAEAKTVAGAVAALEATHDANREALAQKEAQWEGILASAEYRHQKFVADTWCAAFVWPKMLGALTDVAPTTGRWREIRDGQSQPPPLMTKTVTEISAQYRFFHWPLQFPQVFAKGGFDVVLGNPPWEQVELKEEEWFAARRPDIAGAANAAARKKLIAKLAAEDAALFEAFQLARRRFDGETHLIRASRRFPLCARGRINTYAIFAEHNRSVLAPYRRAGFIVPGGLVTDDTTKEFFESLVTQRQLVSCLHFENEEKVFPGVHNAFRFVLLTLGSAEQADLVFFARNVEALKAPDRHVSLTATDFQVLNPNTRTCPTFRSRRDATINLAMYRHAGIFWRDADQENGNPWKLRFMQGLFNMASDSALFRTRAELIKEGAELDNGRFVGKMLSFLPLVEAKMLWQFDHRFATYEGATEANLNKGTLPQTDDPQHQNPLYGPTPEYWVAQSEVDEQLAGRWARGWLLGWRDITGTDKQRTVVAALLPRVAVGHTTPLMFSDLDPTLITALYGSLCSFALDYAARQKVGGTHLTYTYLKQLPVLAPSVYGRETPWQQGTTLRDFILPRVLELTYTAWDLEPFARDVGYEGPPFRWDPERRFLLRCELDAAFFHVYGLARGDTDYVMETFPIIRKNDEKAYGTYRTKDAILEIYDSMAEAARTDRTYQARLRPADPLVAHSPRVALPAIPEMPSVRPSLPPSQDAAILIWAILHADQGAIRRSDLARAFALRNRPELLTRLAPAAVKAVATKWAKARGTATTTGTLAGVLSDLAGRSGVDITIDAEGRSMVKLNANAPALDKIEDWYRFEARLVVHVLKSLPATNMAAVDAAVAGDDRALLVS